MAGFPGMTPEMMKMAQEQVARMSPEQLAAMQAEAAKMDPAMLRQFGLDPAQARQAAEDMKRLSPKDLARQAEEMQKMSPDELRRQMSGAQAQSQAQREYNYKASETLKNEGNKLVGAGKHAEAEEKYRRAKVNLAEDSTSAGKELRKSCTLNLSLCLLKLGRAEAAAEEASEVLALDKRSLKGYFRRGLARQAEGKLREAVSDLARASSLSPEDTIVGSALKEAREAAAAAGVEVEQGTPAPLPADEPEQLWTPGAAAAASNTSMPSMSSAALNNMREQMRSNPDMMKNMSDMMANLSEEQIAQMTAASSAAMPGMPKITPEMAQQAASMMKNMSPEAMDSMMDMATRMQASGGLPAMGANGDAGISPDMMAQMQEQLKNPETKKAMAEMMKNISPEMLEQMSASSGMKISADDAHKMASAMQNMKPEHMDRLLAGISMLAGVAARLKAARAWAQKNQMLVAALLVLAIALLLRRWLARRATPAPVAVSATPLEEDLARGATW